MRETLLRDITDYCRQTRMAESTFGRLAVNDGKLVNRLRLGGRVTTDTEDRVRAFIARPRAPATNGADTAAPAVPMTALPGDAQNFRFYDNRQKYLLFVTTCSEKWVIAQRVRLELATSIHARRRSACSTPAPATGPCWCARCARCTTAFRRCRSISSARRSASKTCGSRSKRCPTGCSSTRRPCW
jgi:hypothetical protein